MSNNRQKTAHPPTTNSQSQISTQQLSQINTATQNSTQLSQIEYTFTTLQLPIAPTTSLSGSTSQNQPNNICQSIQYRADQNTQFCRTKALLWEIKFIISSLVSKKGMPQTTTDLQQLSLQFGADFDKYLIRELLEQIDLKDPNKPSRDRTEPVKCILLNEELKRISEQPQILQYFDEISRSIFGESRNKEFLKEICSRLKLSPKMALLIALSLHDSSLNESDRIEAAILIKQKLIEYHVSGSTKAEPLEEYFLHRLLHIFRCFPEFDVSTDSTSSQFESAKRFLIEHHQIKPSQHVALRLTLTDGDLINQNPTIEDPANSLIRQGSGLNHLSLINKLIEPWEVLLDLGHMSSMNYQMLSNVLQDFKDINEKQMASMLLNLSVNYSGQDDISSRIVFAIFEVNKTGDAAGLKKEPNEKITQMQWHAAHFSRAFRENYSNLNWTRVLESFAELSEESTSLAEKFDSKAYAFFLQVFNKSKPQNLQVPIQLLLEQRWQNSSLQLKFISNAINAYISGEDKTFSFAKCQRRIGQVSELPDVNSALIDVWSSPELLQILLNLSETCCYSSIRQILDQPISQCPQYLMLSLSQVQVDRGSILFDELISILMSSFIENYPSSNPVLKKLWDFNQNLMIRSISELCNYEDPSTISPFNTNKVLDITQDIKDSLKKFVNCQDYDFAVNLGIIAAKRDYLNYDQWLRDRITTAGNAFLRSLCRYFLLHFFKPVQDLLIKNNLPVPSAQNLNQQNSQIEEEKIAQIIENVLEKANLLKARLNLTIEILQKHFSEQQSDGSSDDQKLVIELIEQFQLWFPRQFVTSQQSEVDKVANQHFTLVFEADQSVVEQRIQEFLTKVRVLSKSQVQRDRDIFNCILHTLYDEYRFILSFKDRKMLISFAQLFGGIINKNILDDRLMEISIKFILQALHNNDNRVTFGVEALKQCYQFMTDNPQHLTEIYQKYEGKIKEQDPAFHAKFVHFYLNTFNQNTQNKTSDESKEERQAHRPAVKQNQLSQPDSEIQSQSDISGLEDQKLQLAKQKDRGESQKANAKTSDQKNNFQNVKNQQQQQNKNNNVQQNLNDKRKSPEQKITPVSGSQNNKNEKDTIDQQKQYQQNNIAQNQQQFLASQSLLPGGLNIQSEAFNRVVMTEKQPAIAISQMNNNNKPSINVNAMTFNPTEVPAPFELNQPTKQYTQSIEAKAWQENIDKKISEAKKKGVEISFQDLIEDPLLKQISVEDQTKIRVICNNTGQGTFDGQLQNAQRLLQGPNADVTLTWFLHYFLIQRLVGTVPQMQIYIELFQKLGNKNVVSKAIHLCLEIVKRCMLIPEEELNKVLTRSQSQTNIIKQFLQKLGQFIGMLTLASNRPIFTTEVDLKQLLIEGFQNRNRYVIIFVCRILREATKVQLQIFNRTNPWILSLLEILKEIYDITQQKQVEDTQTEIQLLFKDFNLNIHDFPSGNLLKARLTSSMTSRQQEAEVLFYDKKEFIIPMRVVVQQQSQLEDPKSTAQNVSIRNLSQDEQRLLQMQQQQQRQNGVIPFDQPPEEFNDDQRRHNNQMQILNNVVINPNQLFRQFKITEQDYRKVISEALDQSIQDILPPVVTRSVSIALITTKQLVLKDFTYDSDVQKVTEAINQFAKNSAGSLALVTCREPLRISLTDYLVKEIKQCCFKFGTRSGLTNGDELRMRDQSGASIAAADEMDQRLNQYITDHEELIQEVANNASKENLELGCNIIKATVFDDTAQRIRQDEEICQAMEKRRLAQIRGEQFVDEQHVSNFADLPEILRPNPNGLTQNQLRVYQDFSKLNQRQNMHQTPAHAANFLFQDRSQQQQNNIQRQREPSSHSFTLDSIISDIEKVGQLTSFTRTLMTLKLQEICKTTNVQNDAQAQRKQADIYKSLWRYTEKKFMDLQMFFDGTKNSEETKRAIAGNLEILALIVKKFKVEDFSKRLLNEIFLKMEEMYLFNVDLNIALLSKGILNLTEWDKSFSVLIMDAPGNLLEKVVHFMVRFVETTILSQQIQTLTPDKIPCFMQTMNSLQLGSDSQAQALKLQLEQTRVSISLEELEQTPFQKQLKSYFLQWVELLYITDTAEQEDQMNRFFEDLGNLLQIQKDQVNLFEFCNVCIRVSIDLTKQSQSGELRDNNALLNYHFIDNFIKLVVLLLKAFEFNKQELMSKILEFIRIKLDIDHQQQLKAFNQKPYYRMLINILTVLDLSDCFNIKTSRQILFDMADLLNQLQPNNYPAFAFAWLQLISHRLFMPHFIKRQDASQNQAWFKIKDLLVSCFTFLKHNMIPGQPSSKSLEAFYVGTIRIILIILKDYPEFLCDFHFNFVNSLPDHAIQLKNMILAAMPRSVSTAPDPLTKDLRLDPNNDVKEPRILSNFEAYLSVKNLKEDLDNYFKSKKHSLIKDICNKMMESIERINGRQVPSSAVINAVVLYITQQKCRSKDDSLNYIDLCQQITDKLNDETRVKFLNSIVNELRYPNSHTYNSCILLNELFMGSEPHIKEQIQRILFERLQAHRPHPWGLSINFREFMQNGKYGFSMSPLIKSGKADFLFKNRLRPFFILIEEQKNSLQQLQNRPHLE